jgi:hypothetical protein
MNQRKQQETEVIPFDPEDNIKLNPEDIDEDKQSIEEAAYYIGMNRQYGSHQGDHLSDWLAAEKAIKGESETE